MKHWKELSRSDLAKLNEKMSAYEIAREYKLTPAAVYYRLRTFGINTLHIKKRFDPPKEELAALYKQMSMGKIAEHYGVGETVVFNRLKDHRIGGITKSDRLKGKPKSLEHRLAMSRSTRASGVRAGKRNGNWKGGVSSSNKLGRSRAAYHDWKKAVLANAGWKCQSCGKEQGYICECCGHRILLHSHHIKSFADNVSLRYDPKNGKALCSRCHWEEHHD